MRSLHAQDARLEAWLTSGAVVETGADAVIDVFSAWHPAPATLVHWEARTYDFGYSLEYEPKPADGAPSRSWHHVFTKDGQITGHAVWEDRAQHVDMTEVTLPDGIASIVANGVRSPLSGGLSGAPVERIAMPDGRRFVLKHLWPSRGWLVRATRDPGREATLWKSGLLERVPDSIDFPVVAAEPEADGWALLMRDISDTLVGSQMHGGLRPRWASTIGVGSCGPPDDCTPRSAGSSSPMRVGWRTGS